jgi:hypothetical protein
VLQAALDAIEAAAHDGPDGLAGGVATPGGAVSQDLFAAAAGAAPPAAAPALIIMPPASLALLASGHSAPACHDRPVVRTVPGPDCPRPSPASVPARMASSRQSAPW